MSEYLVKRIEATENIRLITGVEVTRVSGDTKLESATIRNVGTGAETVLNIAAMFIFIGQSPHSEVAAGFVDVDDKGFVLTGSDIPKKKWTLERDPFLFETAVPGIFAVGDVRAGANRRVAAAVGEGSAGIYMVHRYLETV
jgi:thioredoxin reductase (NADPH)